MGIYPFCGMGRAGANICAVAGAAIAHPVLAVVAVDVLIRHGAMLPNCVVVFRVVIRILLHRLGMLPRSLPDCSPTQSSALPRRACLAACSRSSK